jgi:electron transport complex protein RnfG
MTKIRRNWGILLVGLLLISSAAAGSIFVLTESTIKATRVEKFSNTIASVVPSYDNDPVREKYTEEIDGYAITFCPATKNGKLVGMAVEAYTDDGYSGRINLLVGFLPDGTIHGISVLAHHETPGLGSKIVERPTASNEGKFVFSSQFIGKNPAKFKLSIRKDGGEIDAITSSTISSRAYCNAVQRAYTAFMAQPKEKKK